MKLKDIRKKNDDKTGIKAPRTIDPKDSSNGGNETTHQNDDLLKMKESAPVWFAKAELPVVSESIHHKVKVHIDGRTEIRYIDNQELAVLKKSRNVTKVEHIGRIDKNGVLHEGKQAEETYAHTDGRKATLVTHKYADPSLGEDHYVHLPDGGARVFPEKEKAVRLMSKLGFKPEGVAA